MLIKDIKVVRREWKVRSKSNPNQYHIVGWDGKDYWECDCIAGSMNRECRHKRLVRNTLKGLKKKNYGKIN